MVWLWTWGGTSFGYREGVELWTHDGRHVGRFHGEEIYGSDGRYLGELMSGNRLITNRSKLSWRQPGFGTYGRRGAYARYADYAGYAMYAGHEDFPAPSHL
jgi:hypothetical protein